MIMNLLNHEPFVFVSWFVSHIDFATWAFALDNVINFQIATLRAKDIMNAHDAILFVATCLVVFAQDETLTNWHYVRDHPLSQTTFLFCTSSTVIKFVLSCTPIDSGFGLKSISGAINSTSVRQVSL